jgi:outer membrane protein
MKKILPFLIACLINFSSLKAQQLSLSFEEAIDIALKQNLKLRSQQNQLQVLQTDKVQNYASFIPKISLRGSAGKTNGRQFDETTGKIATQSVERLNWGLNASWTLFNGFERIHAVKQSQHQFHAQEHLVRRIEQEVIFVAAQQYLQVLLDQELLKIAKQNLLAQQKQLKQILEFVKLGIRPLYDQYAQEAEVKRLELAVIQAESEWHLDKTRLVNTLQLEPGSSIILEDLDYNQTVGVAGEYLIENLYQKTLASRPDYQQAKCTSEAASHHIAIARSGYIPSINLFYNWGSGFSSFQERSIENQLFKDNIYSSFGIGLNIPVFDGLRSRGAMVSAKVNHENTKLELKEIENVIYLEVQTALQDYNTLQQSLNVSEAHYTAAQKALTAQEERYKLGAGNLTELVQANSNFIQAASGKVQARYNLFLQKMVVDYYTGGLIR